jgi:hypothetical protein
VFESLTDAGNRIIVYSLPLDSSDMSLITRQLCPPKRVRTIYSRTLAGQNVRLSKESTRETFAIQPSLFHHLRHSVHLPSCKFLSPSFAEACRS